MLSPFLLWAGQIFLALGALTGCSVYQSEGRECIEKKCSKLTFPQGFSKALSKTCAPDESPPTAPLSTPTYLSEGDWYASFDDGDRLVLVVDATSCVYVYDTVESLLHDYKEWQP